MDNLPIVLVVVAIVALLVYVLFFRKKELPETGVEKRAIEPRAGETTARKEGKDGLGPTPKPTAPESLPSAEVLPDESANVPAVTVEPTTATAHPA